MTPKIYEIHDILTFGKYQGMTVAQAARREPSYIEWARDNADYFTMTAAAQKWFSALVANLDRSKAYQDREYSMGLDPAWPRS